VRHLGGELRPDRTSIEAAAAVPRVPMALDAAEGPIVRRIAPGPHAREGIVN
jgi:hypothetical protein